MSDTGYSVTTWRDGIGWGRKWIEGLGWRGPMYTPGPLIGVLMYGKNHHNIVIILQLNK